MPKPSQRSRSLRRVKRTTPGGSRKVHYKRRKVGKPVCRLCGRPLSGVPARMKARTKNLSKSRKRPSRAYGGDLCTGCAKSEIKRKGLGGFGY